MALFVQARDDIKQLCKQTVILNQKLPMTKYLSYGVWIVMTNTDLKFTVRCQSNIAEPSDIKVKPPFGIATLNNTCKASNKYLQLSEYVDKHGMFKRSDPLQSLLLYELFHNLRVGKSLRQILKNNQQLNYHHV